MVHLTLKHVVDIESSILSALDEMDFSNSKLFVDIDKLLNLFKEEDPRMILSSIKSLSTIFSFTINEKDVNPFKTFEITKRRKRKIINHESEEEKEIYFQRMQYLNNIHKRFLLFIQYLLQLMNQKFRATSMAALKSLLQFEDIYMNSTSPDMSPHKNTLLSWVVGYLLLRKNLPNYFLEVLKKEWIDTHCTMTYHYIENIEKLIKHQYHQVGNAEGSASLDFYGSTFSHIKMVDFEKVETKSGFVKNAFKLLEIVDMKVLKANFEKSKSNIGSKMVTNSDSEEDFDESNEDIMNEDGSEEDDDNENEDESMEEEEEEEDEEAVEEAEEEESDIDEPLSFNEYQKVKKVFTSCWVEFLGLEMTTPIYKSALGILNDKVIPFMTKPILLYEFLSDSFSIGGVVSMLALESLFTLIKKHNVDYPDFYKKLYSLFTPELFFMKHRKKFLNLSYMFLQTSRLPTHTVCSFIKRLARMSLTAPPQGNMVIVAFIHNLFVRHPSALTLIHRPPKPENQPKPKQGIPNFPLLLTFENTLESVEKDPFDPNEEDPAKTNAIDSSLWELRCLMNHYVPWVSDIVKTIFSGNELKKVQLNIDDFVGLSYSQMFQTEYKRKNKNYSTAYQDPPAFFDQAKFKNFAM